MANSIPKKRGKAEQLRKRRSQAASGLATGAKSPLKAKTTKAVSEAAWKAG